MSLRFDQEFVRYWSGRYLAANWALVSYSY